VTGGTVVFQSWRPPGGPLVTAIFFIPLITFKCEFYGIINSKSGPVIGQFYIGNQSNNMLLNYRIFLDTIALLNCIMPHWLHTASTYVLFI